MRRSFAVLATAALMLAVMCCSAWAEDHAIVYEDHYTLCEFTNDYKPNYSATHFGGFQFHILVGDPANDIIAGDSLTITPKGTAFVGYVRSRDFFGPAGNVEDHLGFKLPFITQADLRSSKKVSTPIKHKVAKYTEQGKHGPFSGEILLDDAGDMPIYGVLGDTATEAALSEADYSLTLGGKTTTGKLGKILTTEEQLRNTAVPYVEMEVDANGDLQSVTFRAVMVNDPSTAIVFTNNDDPRMGMFANAYLKTSLNLKNGETFGSYSTTGKDPFHGMPSPGEKLETTIRAPFYVEDNSSTRAVNIREFSTAQIENDGSHQWVFYPKQNSTPGKYDGKVSGGGSKTWSGSGKLVITIDVEFGKFVRILIGGVLLDPRWYTAKSGSTIIELDEAYLKTLGKGTHDLSVVFTDGTAEIKLTTGGGSNGGGSGGGCSAGAAAIVAIAALAMMKRRIR